MSPKTCTSLNFPYVTSVTSAQFKNDITKNVTKRNKNITKNVTEKYNKT